MKEDASSEYMYLDLECSESLNVQGKYLCMKYFVQLSVCMSVYLSVPFCLLCMHILYIYICICLLSTIVSTGVSVCLCLCLSVCLSLSLCLPVTDMFYKLCNAGYSE